MFRRRQRTARRARSTYRSPFLYGRKPLYEVLEERRMLAVFTVLNTNDSGADSLRDAIETANASGTDDIIQFAAALNGDTITLQSALPTITNNDLDITAAALSMGITIDADGVSRIFDIDFGGGTIDVTLNNLTLTGGDVTGGGGAIRSVENLEVINSTISGNHATIDGGGIYSRYGELSVTGSTISENIADDDGGGIFSYQNTLSVTNSTITGNTSGDFGGGIDAYETTTTISGSTISGNSAADEGGGIYFYDTGASVFDSTISGNMAEDGGGVSIRYSTGSFGRNTISGNSTTDDGGGVFAAYSNLSVFDSTISGNSASGNGGGIYAYEDDISIDDSTISGNTGLNGGGLFLNGVAAEIENSTISGNFGRNYAGGIYAELDGDASLEIRYSTITRNTANFDQGVVGSGGGMYLKGDGGSVTLANTIVAQNKTDVLGTAPDLDNTTAADTPTLTADYNLIGIDEGSGLAPGNPDANGNLIGTVALPIDPMLGDLMDNGGYTFTHALLVGSPAINTGDPGFGGFPLFDQRGNPFDREVGGRLDIGAYEFAPPPFPFFLGSEPTIILGEFEGISIFSGQIHTYQYRAHSTGKLFVRTYFDHSNGNIDLQVLDENQNVIETSSSSSATQDFEEIIIPVVTQEIYYIRVYGTNGFEFNTYALEVENFPTPVPTGVHLDPADDTGMMNNDGVTMEKRPTFFIQTDVFNFVDTNNSGTIDDDPIHVLTADEAAEGDTAGVAVEITLVNTTTATSMSFFADPLIDDIPEVYVFTPTADLEAGVYMVSARTKIFDPREDEQEMPDPAMGRSNASPPLWITIDCEAPFGGTFELLSHSDSGMYDFDHVTNKMQPAFQGVGELNTKVFVFAQRTDETGTPITDYMRVGSGVVDSLIEDDFGFWEVTVEPLIDGKYNFLAIFEDLAGNISDPVGASAEIMTAVNMPIPDPGMVESTIEVTEDDFPDIVGNAADMFYETFDVNVLINIQHPNDQDLVVTLIGPDGTEVELTSNNGGTGNNYTNTIFDDTATTSITAGIAPFTGRFIPEESLNQLNGKSPFGEWTLRVEDDAGNDFSGEFLNWTLNIEVPLMVVIDTIAPNTPFLDLQSGPTVRSTLFVDDNTLGTVTDVDVTISIDHPHVADLTVYLVSPEGTRVLLTANNGGDGANYTDTEFDDEAAVSITTVVTADAPFTGTFRPQGLLALADFDGEDPFGLWTLEVTDDFQPYTGQIIEWTLDISGTLDDFTRTSEDVLDISSDTGRHDHDNITKDNTPTVTMTSSDLNVAFSQLLWTDNFKFRIYDRYEDTAEFLLYDSALDADVDEYLSAGDMFTALTFITEVLPLQYFDLFGTNNAVLDVSGEGVLADGVHNLKLEVEDRAGNISHDFLLEITIDTHVPPVSFGLPNAADNEDGLAADSDTGVVTMPMTFADRITSDTTPRLWGRAEANTIVQVYFDVNNDGVIDLNNDIFLGQTVALPFDGNDAYPDGYWELNVTLDLNEIDNVPRDGLRQLLVTAEDVAGNPMPMDGFIQEGVDVLQIFIDTQGPQVNDVYITDYDDYDLFDPKPSEDGYTPLVFSLTIEFIDYPDRVAFDFLYEAVKEDIATNRGNYLLVGDHVGVIAIADVFVDDTFIQDGFPAFTEIVLEFFEPLPDDRYTLTILDNIVDPAGNNLDGESSADEPQDFPFFPSGDHVPGGDFIARFTVDSRPEIGSYVAKSIQIDINGNFVWDPSNAQIGNDATNVDITFTLPVANPGGSVGLGGFNVHDLLFAGKFRPLDYDDWEDGQFNGNGKYRYFDQLAAYGFSAELGVFRWIIDTNSDGVVTIGTDIITTQLPLNNFDVASAIPVAGNFDGDAANGDEIGLYNRGVWALDLNHNFTIDPGEVVLFGNLLGQPFVGDFDGDMNDDFAVFNNNVLYFDLNQDGFADQTIVLGFPGVLDKVVTADMDQDCIDDLFMWVPRSSANPTGGAAEWYIFLSDTYNEATRIANFGTVNLLDHAFTPDPFGSDLFAVFGAERALPIVGNFDPPVSTSSSSTAAASTSTAPTTNSTSTNNSSATSGSSSTSTETTTPPAKSVTEPVESSTSPTNPTTSTKSTPTTTSQTTSTPTSTPVTKEETQTPTKSTTTSTPAAQTQTSSQSQQPPAKSAAPPATSTSSSSTSSNPASNGQGGSGGTSTAPVVNNPASAPAPAPIFQVPVNLGAAISAYKKGGSVKVAKVVAPVQPTPNPVVDTKSTTAAKPVAAPVTISAPKTVTASTPTSPAPAPVPTSGKINLAAAIAAYKRPAAKPAPASTSVPTAANTAASSSNASASVASPASAAPVTTSQPTHAAASSLASYVVAVPPVAQFFGLVSPAPLASAQQFSEAVDLAMGFFPTVSSDAQLHERLGTPLLATPLASDSSSSEELLLQAPASQQFQALDGLFEATEDDLEFSASDEELLEALGSEQADGDAQEDDALEVALQDWDGV